MNPLKHPLAIGLLAAASVVAAHAASFIGTPANSGTSALDGYSASGFTFHGSWANYGYDAMNLPFMEYYDQDHYVTFDAGTFTFENMTLGGWPWNNYGNGSGNVLYFDFLDLSGAIIASGQLTLALDNSFATYTQEIAGVHEIFFHATNGFWPRLLSINEAAGVPDSAATLLLFVGALGALAGLRRRLR